MEVTTRGAVAQFDQQYDAQADSLLLEKCPAEIILKIIRYLPPHEACKFFKSCKYALRFQDNYAATLEHLQLRMTTIGDERFQVYLTKFTRVMTIDIILAKNITKAGFEAAARLPNVKEIACYGCTQISETERKALVDKHPNVHFSVTNPFASVMDRCLVDQSVMQQYYPYGTGTYW